MTPKKWLIAFAVILVLTSLLNFLIHAILLSGAYAQSPALARTGADGQAHMPYLFVAFVFFAVAFVELFPSPAERDRWLARGFRYGVTVWLMATVSRHLVYYAIQPWPFSTVLLQLGYELVMMLLMGEVLAFVASR